MLDGTKIQGGNINNLRYADDTALIANSEQKLQTIVDNCLFVNRKYCHRNNIHVIQHICSPDVEILSVSLRPYYLPREFPKVCMNVVYVPPSGNDEAAAQALADAVNNQLNRSPDSAVIVTGDV